MEDRVCPRGRKGIYTCDLML